MKHHVILFHMLFLVKKALFRVFSPSKFPAFTASNFPRENFPHVVSRTARKCGKLTTLLPGLKQIDIETDAMSEFLVLLQNNCLKLNTLDLSESNVDNECCNVIGEINSLSVLNLNHCTKLESAGVLHLLQKLKSLTKIDALRGE